MTTIVIACAAALIAAALAVTVFALGRRSRGTADAKLFEVASELDARMESMVRDLSAALERAQAENRRTRALGELGGSIDLDEVLARTLDAASRLAGVDATVVSVPVEGGEPLVAAAGLGGAVTPTTISGPPDGKSPRMIVV
jgi:C4-dicarboxylate-specific signal transduction histidine kinase